MGTCSFISCFSVSFHLQLRWLLGREKINKVRNTGHRVLIETVVACTHQNNNILRKQWTRLHLYCTSSIAASKLPAAKVQHFQTFYYFFFLTCNLPETIEIRPPRHPPTHPTSSLIFPFYYPNDGRKHLHKFPTTKKRTKIKFRSSGARPTEAPRCYRSVREGNPSTLLFRQK